MKWENLNKINRKISKSKSTTDTLKLHPAAVTIVLLSFLILISPPSGNDPRDCFQNNGKCYQDNKIVRKHTARVKYSEGSGCRNLKDVDRA